MTALAEGVRRKADIDIIIEHPRKGEKHAKANGEVERANQTVAGMTRTLKSAVEEKIGEIRSDSPLMAWMVEYSAKLCTLFSLGMDGMTAYQRLKGRPWRIPLPSFGEAIWFSTPSSRKLESRWAKGIFLGVSLSSTEKLVGTPAGVITTTSIRRIARIEERWDAELAKNMIGYPWKPKGEMIDRVSAEPRAEQPRPNLPLLPPPPEPAETKGPRKFYVTIKELVKFGWSPNCPGCEAMKNERPARPHSEECRRRILEKLGREDPRAQETIERQIRKRLALTPEDD